MKSLPARSALDPISSPPEPAEVSGPREQAKGPDSPPVERESSSPKTFGTTLGEELSGVSAGDAASAVVESRSIDASGLMAAALSRVEKSGTGPEEEKKEEEESPSSGAVVPSPGVPQPTSAMAQMLTSSATRGAPRRGSAPFVAESPGALPKEGASSIQAKKTADGSGRGHASQDLAAAVTARGLTKTPLAPPGSSHSDVTDGPERRGGRDRAVELGAKVKDPAGLASRTEPSAAAILATDPRLTSRTATATATAPQSSGPTLPVTGANQDLQGAVLQSAAHIKIETGTLGALELHLRIRDGALHLRVDGDAARVVEARAAELSRTLAGDGLRLAPLDVTPRDAGLQAGGEGGRQFQERREAWNEAMDARASTPTPSHLPTRTEGEQTATHAATGLHVEA